MIAPPLVAAVTDPQLFGFVPYPRQRELLGAAQDGARTQVWALGRRSGKSTMAALIALHNCLFRPDLDAMVRPGERRYAVVVATNRAQARIIVQAARSIVERSPLLAPLAVAGDMDSVDFALPGGARTALHAFPCNARYGRGFPISCLIFDEAAHFLSETDGDATAARVWSALHPSTAQFGEAGKVIVCSTPWGTEGLFAELFAQARSGELPDAEAHQFATAQCNPTVAADFLASERARDPDTFGAEYEARFEGSGAAFFDFERFDVMAADPVGPTEGSCWIAGLDPAFTHDPFGVALVGRDLADPGRLVIGSVFGIRPDRSTTYEERRAVEDAVLRTVADECRRYGAEAVTDQYQARAVTDRLLSAGVAVRVENMSARTKTQAYTELRARLYDGTLELRDDPDLVAELRRVRTRFTAGSASVITPRVGGSHGDMAQALALAVLEQSRRGGAAGEVRGRLVDPDTDPGFGDLLRRAM